ncbi:MAG TPA: N-acetyl-gamma-glutamyl-phosphate reductase [Clostridiales bacterium UBA8960]|jgi:N-acetyl-gamma-glutamyl-phosphate reductase|nr:N-acetyl-gamma-glutamyl-phosphate reductase [Clostridiales bacterium UBA8960]
MNIVIAGSTGYAGQQLTSLLVNHPNIKKIYLGSSSQSSSTYDAIYAHTKGIIFETLLDSDTLLTPSFLEAHQIDCCFLALPHGMSSKYVPDIIDSGALVIDLGSDYRLEDAENYVKWHGVHASPHLLDQGVYGLSEFYSDKLGGTKLIANPGCYATATLLAMLPAIQAGLIKDPLIIVDAKSGISGAGRQASQAGLFAEAAENIRPYKTGDHQHIPEIEQTLSQNQSSEVAFKVMFSPSVVPMTRGLLSAVYAKIDHTVDMAMLDSAYNAAYADKPFIRLLNQAPCTKNVRGSNYADIWYKIDHRTGTLIMMCAIDNLMKGAAGQAVQNMNLHFGFEETVGLGQMPLYP